MAGNADWRVLSFRLERADYMKFRTNTYLRPQSLLSSLLFLIPVALVFAVKALYEANDWSYLGYAVIVAFAIYYLYVPWLGHLTLLDI